MEDEFVWTTNLQTVRIGIWRWGGAPIPLEEGKWETKRATRSPSCNEPPWLKPERPAPVASPPHPIGEIIAEQSLYNPLEENEEEQADWWKDWGEDVR